MLKFSDTHEHILEKEGNAYIVIDYNPIILSDWNVTYHSYTCTFSLLHINISGIHQAVNNSTHWN